MTNSIHNKNLVAPKRFFKQRMDEIERKAQERDRQVDRYANRNARLLVRSENADIPIIKAALRKILPRGVVKQRVEEIVFTDETFEEFNKALIPILTSRVKQRIFEQVIRNNREAAQGAWVAIQETLVEGVAPAFPDYLDRKIFTFVNDALEGYSANYVQRIRDSLRKLADDGVVNPEDIANSVISRHGSNKYIARTAARTITGSTFAITSNAAFLADPSVEWV